MAIRTASMNISNYCLISESYFSKPQFASLFEDPGHGKVPPCPGRVFYKLSTTRHLFIARIFFIFLMNVPGSIRQGSPGRSNRPEPA